MTSLDSIYETRKTFTAARLGTFSAICEEKLRDSMETVIGDHGCIYAVGSAGRKEITSHSDLDIFLVDIKTKYESEEHKLNEMILKSAVLRSLRELKLPDPSNGGEFLQLHTTGELTKQIGQRTDDPQNTFTARMLLLLESHPLIGNEAYDHVVEEVLSSYWQYYKGHEQDYVPILLINDIVRYWRVLLLNYVAMNVRQSERNEPNSEEKRRLRSYKLRFSRCLTCYSALAYLLSLRKSGITTGQVKEMVGLCPHERLRRAGEQASDELAKSLVDDLLDQYAHFLETVDQEKSILLNEFIPSGKDARFKEGDKFGRTMASLMLQLGKNAPDVFRYMLV